MAIPAGKLKSSTSLLDALGALADPQVALRLLRSSPRLLKKPRLLRLLLWFTDASAPLPGFTWLTSSGNKPLAACAMRGLGFDHSPLPSLIWLFQVWLVVQWLLSMPSCARLHMCCCRLLLANWRRTSATCWLSEAEHGGRCLLDEPEWTLPASFLESVRASGFRMPMWRCFGRAFGARVSMCVAGGERKQRRKSFRARWCFTGQAPTLWPVLVFLPGVANLIWLRPSGWMSWLKLAGVAVCSQCLCWLEAVPPWRSQCLWKTLRGLCTAGCRNQLRVGARGFQDPSPAPPGSDFVDRLWWKRLLFSGVPTSVALRVILLDCVRCSFPLFGGRPAQTLVFPSIQK